MDDERRLVERVLTKFAETIVASCARSGVRPDHPVLVQALYAALPLAEDRFRCLADELVTRISRDADNALAIFAAGNRRAGGRPPFRRGRHPALLRRFAIP